MTHLDPYWKGKPPGGKWEYWEIGAPSAGYIQIYGDMPKFWLPMPPAPD